MAKIGFFCALLTNNMDLIRLLLTESLVKVDLEYCSPDNLDIPTPLVHAVKERNLPLAKMLLEAGADPDHLPMEGAYNPLASAFATNNIDMCKLLTLWM